MITPTQEKIREEWHRFYSLRKATGQDGADVFADFWLSKLTQATAEAVREERERITRETDRLSRYGLLETLGNGWAYKVEDIDAILHPKEDITTNDK